MICSPAPAPSMLLFHFPIREGRRVDPLVWCRCYNQEQGSLHRLGMPQPMHQNKRERLSVLIRSKVLHKSSVQLAVRRSRCSDGARFAKVNEMETGSKVPFVFGVCKCRTAADTGSARQQRAGTILMQICSLQHAN